MKKSRLAAALALAFPLACPVWAQSAAEAPVKSLGVITITGGRPTSLPTQIPTSYTAELSVDL